MDYLIILLSVLVSGGLWLRYIYSYDRVEPEPISVVLKIIFIGGLISSLVAGSFNELFSYITGIKIASEKLSFGDSVLLSSFVGFNEEIIKAVTTYYLVRNLKDLDEPIDAIIYSTSVGLGFSIFENIQYAEKFGVISILIRSFSAMPLHIGLAAVWGYKIAEVKFLEGKNYYDHMKGSVILAGILHAVYDFFHFYLNNLTILFTITALFAYFLIQYIKTKLDYLSTQSPFLKAGTCSICFTINPLNEKHCKKCKANLVQVFYIICNDCFTKNNIQDTHCIECNSELPRNR
jgi:RsiW-degrading membrane proteinase PrsW (M82 family)